MYSKHTPTHRSDCGPPRRSHLTRYLSLSVASRLSFLLHRLSGDLCFSDTWNQRFRRKRQNATLWKYDTLHVLGTGNRWHGAMWKTCLVSTFSVLLWFWGGLKTLAKSPAGRRLTGPSGLARAECIPVRCKAFCCCPDTTTCSITAGSRIVRLSPAPYNASIHPSGSPPDPRPD